MNEPHPDDLQSRIFDLLDGTLGTMELARLDAELRGSEEARELFRKLATLHSALQEQGSAKAELGARRLIPIERMLTRQRQRMVRFSVLAAAAILLISAVTLWLRMAPTPVASFQVAQGTIFTLTHPDAERAPKGMVLKEGSRLQMSHGTLEATFDSGVRCVIDAPCDVSVIAKDRISIVSGTAWFEVPPSAVGFAVEAGPLEVIDLGTAFGVMARVNTRREVHVTKGLVEVRFTPAGDMKDKLILKAGQARQLDERGEFHEIALQAGRFTTALPETIHLDNPSFEVDRNPSPDGEFAAGEREDFGGQLTGWKSISGNPRQVHVGWRDIGPSEIHPNPPYGNLKSQVLSLINGASVHNVSHTAWSSLRAGDKLRLTICIGLRGGSPRLVWNDRTFFGLTDGGFSPTGIPTAKDTIANSGIIHENPATGNRTGDGTFADVSLEHTVLPEDLKRPGNIGVLIVGETSEEPRPENQSMFDNVRLRVERQSREAP